MLYALILFIAMPILEIALLLRVGEVLGWAPTLLVVIATALIGSAMLRQQGLATLNRARTRMDAGEMPAQQLLEGVLIMIGGVLLLTPGFMTDAFGFACLIPVSRQWLASQLSARAVTTVAGGFSSGAGGGFRRPGPSSAGEHQGAADARSAEVSRSRTKRGSGDIIDGDFTRIDDE